MFVGSTRFTEFQRSLGIAPNVLTKRLTDLVAAGVLAVSDGEGRDYVLTDKGWALQPVIVALAAWGDRWAPDERGRPVTYRHSCGGEVGCSLGCSVCAQPVAPEQVSAEVAPWAREARAARPTR